MKRYIVIERGSRGEFENVDMVKSEKEIESFCNMLYESKVIEMKKDLDSEGIEELENYMEEFGGVSSFKDGGWEVGFSEESWFEVYEVVG